MTEPAAAHLAGLPLSAIATLAACGDHEAANELIRETQPGSLDEAIRLAAPGGRIPPAGFDAIHDAYHANQ